MAQFRIHFPPAMMVTLTAQAELIKKLQLKGIQPLSELLGEPEIPNYETFVMDLMKSMATPEEEFHHATTGVSGESGELLDISKKVWVYNKPMTPEMLLHIVEEMGDLRFYYQALLNLFALTDEQIQAANITKLRKRYHEGKYSDAQAQARADKPEEQGLSAAGAKGSVPAAPRSFIGQQPIYSKDQYVGKTVVITSGVIVNVIGKVTSVSPLGTLNCELLEACGAYPKGEVISVQKHEVTICADPKLST